ncbi:baculoviral IAP repeat-containing protein 7 isoform X3 [Dunckerocampus dactyliophorus]|uniref:baculoviral IAP repeat-containing protein 7 isoform X3 n=1 Tax=Dunckerocampus dactyliophorus TaxID=161453 RepID=UPI002407222F|nr:baculoviral IAP repeat-containing protein 7 isoform X3 [Dunckerocampus dactyliophorus]
MPGTAQTQTGTPSRSRMTDDRSTMLYILEEPQMRREGERLRTFQTWPTDAPVTSGDLAKAGFFFLGQGDKVQCFCCGGVLRCWVHGDSPTAEHKRHFPTCSFILGRAVGNIPLQGGSSDSVDGQLLSQLQRMTMDDQGTAGQAVYPEMEAEDSRLTTFHNWPTEASVQPDVLARAGFFYTGHGDNVKCFYCDGGLRNWEPGDDPWQEHAKWFPRCEFLIQSRGQEYISNIQDAHFHLGETVPVGGSQVSTGREVGSRNEPDEGQGPGAGIVGTLTPLREKVPSGREPSPEELLRQLQEERTCKVCMDKLVSIVFIPCGHLVVCGDCAASLRHCPICRAVIRGSVRAFMS